MEVVGEGSGYRQFADVQASPIVNLLPVRTIYLHRGINSRAGRPVAGERGLRVERRGGEALAQLNVSLVICTKAMTQIDIQTGTKPFGGGGGGALGKG